MISILRLIATMVMLCMAFSSFEPVQVICEVNGFMIPAIVDTGAEISVMSTSCAKRCKVSSSIDTQFSGRAIGVGSSDIVGGIEGLGIRIGPLSFQNKISILRNANHRCDFIIGLDILRRFNCDILLRERCIKMYVRGNEVRIPLMQSDSKTDLNGHFQAATKQIQRQSDAAPRNPAESSFDEHEDDLEIPIPPSSSSATYSNIPTRLVAESAVGGQNRLRGGSTYVVNRHCYDDNRSEQISSSTSRVQNQQRLYSSSSKRPFVDPELEKYQNKHLKRKLAQIDEDEDMGANEEIEDDYENYDDNEDQYDDSAYGHDRSVSMAGV